MLNKRINVVSMLSVTSLLTLGLMTSSFAINEDISLNNFGADSMELIINSNGKAQSVFHYPYKGEVQTFVAPMDGIYKFEAWGAEGGDNKYYWGQNVPVLGSTASVATTNNGAYAEGQSYLNKGDTIYVYVGGRGQDETSDINAHSRVVENGGWNGGGNGFGAASAGGGGATDFRLNNDLESAKFTSKSADDTRILVAGGGGGMPSVIPDNMIMRHVTPREAYTSTLAAQSMVGGNTVSRRQLLGDETAAYPLASLSSLKSEYLNVVTTMSNQGENSSNANYGGGGGGFDAGKSFTVPRVVQSPAVGGAVSYAFGQNVGGTSGRNTHLGEKNMTHHTELTGVQTMPHPAGGTQVGNSGHGYAKITMQNTAPTFTLSNTFRDGSSITRGEQIEVTGTIYDEIGNTMSLFMQFGDNAPIEIVNKKTSFIQESFVYNFSVPENMDYGAYDLVFWSEDDLGAISSRTTYRLVYTNKSASAFTHELSTNAWTNRDVTITVVPSAGYPFEYYNNHGSSTAINHGSYNAMTYTASNNGAYTFKGFTYAGEMISHAVSVGNIDKVAPTINYRILNTALTSQDVTIEVEGSDALSGVAKIILPNGREILSNTATYTAVDNGTYKFQVVDNAGNATSRDIVVSNIDKNVPTISVSQDITTLTNKATLTASAESLSGISYIEKPDNIRVYNRDEVNPFTTTFDITKNGEYRFIAENIAGERVENIMIVNNIDDKAPVLNIDYDDTQTNNDVIVRITASDEHGILKLTMPNNSSVLNDNTMYTITTNGTYTFSVTDRAGNVTTKDIVISNINKTGPTFTSSVTPGTWTNDKVQIMINAFSGNVELDEITLPDGTKVNNRVAVYYVDKNGVYDFTLRDALGNITNAQITVDNIDKNPPELIVGTSLMLPNYPTGEGLVLDKPRFFFKVTDTGGSDFILNQSNVNITAPNGDRVFYSGYDEVNGIYVEYDKFDESLNGEWTIKVRDNAGNETIKTHTSMLADGTAPKLSISSHILSSTSKLITAIAVDEGVAGLDYIKTPDGIFHRNTNKVDYVVSEYGEYIFEVADNYGNVRTEKTIVNTQGNSSTELILTPHTEEWISGDVLIDVKTVNVSHQISHIILPNGNVVLGDNANYIITQNGIYEFIAVDVLGNEFKNIAIVSNIDKEEPTVTITNEVNWTNESVDVLIEATDN
ncbi:MAG: glycine rich domain-containing protein [Peptostreptococcaceae bacterium]